MDNFRRTTPTVPPKISNLKLRWQKCRTHSCTKQTVLVTWDIFFIFVKHMERCNQFLK